MENYCNSCGGSNFNLRSGECAYSSIMKHDKFIKAWKNGTDVEDETGNKVLQALRSGKKWLIQKKRNSSCWHPGVKMTNGKCVFCAMTKSHRKGPVSIDESIEAVQADIEKLQAHLLVLQTYKTLGAAMVPEAPRIATPRQQAISEGKRWYMPYEPCKHCGVIAERYVANGKCRNCQQ